MIPLHATESPCRQASMQLSLKSAEPHRDTVRNLTTPFSCLGRSAEDHGRWLQTSVNNAWLKRQPEADG
jgi:hypothetical protein